MKVYYAFLKATAKSILSSKSSAWILLLQATIPTVVMGYLWTNVLANGRTISGMNSVDMIHYYVGVNVVNFFVWYAVDWELNDDIHSGKLANIIRKPINMMLYYISKMVGDRLANILVILPILLLLLLANWKSINFNTGLVKNVLVIIVSALLWFFFSYSVGCLAYWFENLFFVLLVKEIVVSFLSGYYLPISTFPFVAKELLKYLPFQYFNYFPVQIVLGNKTGVSWEQGLLTELIWCFIFLLFSEYVNRKGLRHYSDVLG
ncbi:ABC transporter permease [Levilactobacillus humaensis]|uniref:ABC transporter permease n=1 Tax=Levilactobacillus humaensis TaxID=2950375 RepID=UPI0021C43C9B|nr:ABC-2 family transporter protein [Levilactobacillus humaensis]